MKQKLTLFLSLIIISLTLFAHEFWLLPHDYIVKTGEHVNIRFQVGENFTGENWKGNNSRIEKIIHHTPDKRKLDISSLLSNQFGDSLSLPILSAGTHMITFESTNSFIELEAEKFNSYLLEDGLTNAVDYRREHNETNKPGKEYYKRCTKTIVQCENSIYNNQCTKETSLPLDIIPRDNPYEHQYYPYDQEADHRRWFTIRYNKKPLIQKTVKYWYKQADGIVKIKEYITNKKGQIMIELQAGLTMISCVHMERLADDSSADWQSYWGSLTFKYQRGNFFPKKRS